MVFKSVYDMINILDPDLIFILENTSKCLNLVDISIWIVEKNLVFDIYYQPTNSFSYLTYTSCHPTHKENNILLSLANHC